MTLFVIEIICIAVLQCVHAIFQVPHLQEGKLGLVFTMLGYLINLYCLLMCSYAYALMMICVVVNVNDGVNLAVAHYDNAVAKLHIELT